MIKKTVIKTKMGWISAFEVNGKIIQIKFGKIKKVEKSILLNRLAKKMKNFFNKKITKIKIPHKIKGNKIQKKVWNELKNIKLGSTKSYGDIAKKHNISPRYVGKICGQNKLLLLVPCHRVIRSDGDLGGFSSSGGSNLKKKLLDFEKNF